MASPVFRGWWRAFLAREPFRWAAELAGVGGFARVVEPGWVLMVVGGYLVLLANVGQNPDGAQGPRRTRSPRKRTTMTLE